MSDPLEPVAEAAPPTRRDRVPGTAWLLVVELGDPAASVAEQVEHRQRLWPGALLEPELNEAQCGGACRT